MIAPQAANEKPNPPMPEGAILLVDDDPAMLRIMDLILRRAGFRVWQAVSGEIALEMLKRKELMVDLVIADVIMPGMAGGELMREVQKLKPECKFLFCSGYAEQTSDLMDLDEAAPTLPKPFSPEALRKTVSTLLGKS